MRELQYFDSSALMKVYLEEEGSDLARQLLLSSEQPTASVLAGIEVLANLHRCKAGGRIRPQDFPQVLKDFHNNWLRMLRIPMDAAAERAFRGCQTWRLKGADTLHLATCLTLKAQEAEVVLICADKELAHAAEREGLRVHFVPAG